MYCQPASQAGLLAARFECEQKLAARIADAVVDNMIYSEFNSEQLGSCRTLNHNSDSTKGVLGLMEIDTKK